MTSSKVSLLICLFCIGILFIYTYLSPKRAENSLQTTVQQSITEATISDSRFNNVERDNNLQAEADALLYLFGQMPSVPVYIKYEPILKSGTNREKSAAYTYCDNNELPFVFVKKIFYQKANKKTLINALKHELTHAWLCRQQLMSVGHGAIFQEKFKQVGGFGN